MMEFFTHATANLQTGSLTYLTDVLETYRREQFCGLVEVRFGQRSMINISLLSGTAVGAYYLTASSSIPISIADLDKWWSDESAHIRSLVLPAAAVSIVGMACEWHPPTQTLLIQSSGLPSILQVFLVNKICGLLHIIDSSGELAVPIIDGYTVPDEAVYCGAQIEVGQASLKSGMQPSSHNCTVVLYEAKTDAVSFKQLVLRQVVSEMTGNVISRYQQIVGGSLLRVMSNDLNQTLQLNHLHMRLDGRQLDNSQIFTSMEEAFRSYDFFFKALRTHMTRVIGGNLAGALQREAYRSLNPRSQAALDEKPLMSAVEW